ncbi:dUTP diphosphatase [Chloroflexota bacterium]
MQIARVKFIHPAAKLPAKMSDGSAGYDLYSVEDMEVPPSRCTSDSGVEIGRALVPTGIVLELLPGTVGRVGSRSGMSVKANIEAGAGWIDSDYRGELKVELKNMGSEAYIINRGDRIAQLIILPLASITIEAATEVNHTDRNSSGFGSTGLT